MHNIVKLNTKPLYLYHTNCPQNGDFIHMFNPYQMDSLYIIFAYVNVFLFKVFDIAKDSSSCKKMLNLLESLKFI